MARNKPPVLTSPGKIGFFVSLMLVIMGIGSGYFFMRTFGLSWGLEPFEPTLAWFQTQIVDGVLNRTGFIYQIWPLAAGVAVTALLAHILIAQAVRKYKRYLDSGLDYKNLLSVIEQIEDLEDKRNINKLKNHPDLKNFLTRMRENADTRNAELDNREKSLDKRVKSVEQQKDQDYTRQLGEECQVLVSAIQARDTNDFSDDLNITMVELQTVADAVRAAFADTAGADDLGQAAADSDGMRRSLETLQTRLSGVVGEFNTMGNVAKEIEEQLQALAGASGGDGASAQQPVTEISSSLVSLEKLSASTASLSEEAKSVAINTAMQASSGKSTQSDLIQLAEDIKEIAAKFNDMSRNYGAVTTTMRQAVSMFEDAAGQGGDAPAGDAGATASRASMWVERMMLLTEKMNNIKGSLELSVGAPSAGPAESVAEVATDGEFGFEQLGGNVFSESPVADDVLGIERNDSGVFEEPDSEDNLFAELDEDDAIQVDAPRGEGEVDIEVDAPRTTADATPVEPMTVDAPRVDPDPPAPDASEALDGDPNVMELNAMPTQAAEEVATEPVAAVEEPVVEEEQQSHVIDLYAFGAVDYDPAVHSG